MADDAIGTLNARAIVALPRQSDDHYGRMNHPFERQEMPLFSTSCTRAQAVELVKRIRAYNPDVAVVATWSGDLEVE